MAAPDNIYLELPEKPKVSTIHRNLPDLPVGAGVSDIYLNLLNDVLLCKDFHLDLKVVI